jgi:hypothetical protein
MRALFIALFLFYNLFALGQGQYFIKVHFLYGSTPKKEFKGEEQKWFGGKHGGHVGIEGDSNSIINFLPLGKFHVIEKKQPLHSNFTLHTINSFYEVLGGEADSVKKLIVTIPISAAQKKLFDSIAQKYLNQTPYDYAFIGMRCAAATYDILSRLNIVKRYKRKKMYTKIFYPKLLRKTLLKKAGQNNWAVFRQNGNAKRNWELD